MINWKFSTEKFSLEFNIYKDRAVVIYQPFNEYFQIRTFKLDDYPVFPSDQEEVDTFIKTHFYKLL